MSVCACSARPPARPLMCKRCVLFLYRQVLFLEGGGAGALGRKEGVVENFLLPVARLLQRCLPGRRAFPPLHSLFIISRIF